MNNEAVVDFLKEIEKFKTCERTCRTTDTTRAESDAEHSWHLATFLLLLEDELPEVDFTRVLKLALIHDLPEIYAGDTNPYRSDLTNKEENEKVAADKLFNMLPSTLQHKFTELFEEYLNQTTIEARLVKSADKLMPLIQNLCTNNEYSSYRKLEVDYQEAKDYLDKYFKTDGILKQMYETLLQEAKVKGVFFNNTQNT
jgi:putative hydrolase of HD superfamily